MPRGDGTGPNGIGQMTGRGAGYCGGFNNPSFTNIGFGDRGCGFGPGRRFGRGIGWRYGIMPVSYENNPIYQTQQEPSITKQQQVEILKNKVKALEDSLADIGKRIKEIEVDKK